MEGMFKTAVSGFKKDDVLAYIDKRETEARQKQESLNQRLRKMTAELNEEKNHHTDAVAQAEQLEASLNRERERADGLAKAAGTAEEEKRALKAQLNDARFEVARLQQDLATAQKEKERILAEQEAARAKAEEQEDVISKLNDKLNQSVKTEDLIGRVLLEAQTTADKILSEAKDTAARELADAQEKSAAVLNQARSELMELLAQTAQFRSEVGELREGTQRAFSHIDTLLENVERSADHIHEVYQAPLTYNQDQEEPPVTEETEQMVSEEAAADAQDLEPTEEAASSDCNISPATFNFSRTTD